MAWLCIVENCRNASPFTPKDCKMFSVSKDELLCKQWLINVKRQDLCDHSVNTLHKNHRVCSDHFKCSMFSNTQRTSLLPSAVPTEFVFNYDDEFSSSTSFIGISISDPLFSNNSIATSTPIKQNRSTCTNLFNYEEVSFSSSSLDMSISDPLFLNNSNAASAPLLQNQQHKPNQKSTSTTCVPLSLRSMHSASSSVASTSIQSTQSNSLDTSMNRMFEIEIRERSKNVTKQKIKLKHKLVEDLKIVLTIT